MCGATALADKLIRARQAPREWREWLTGMFPAYYPWDFAPHHARFWDWVWQIEADVRPPSFVGVWPREGGKSVSAETAVVAIAAKGLREYAWYVRATQDQADKSVGNIADMLEAPSVAEYYPEVGKRQVGKFGNVKGWRRNRLRTKSGFTIDAIGFDTAARGARVKENRPGLIIFDDVDEKHDSALRTKKKLETMTHSLLPAGSQDCAVVFIQNVMIPEGICARLAGLTERPAEFLADRIVSGPHPAVVDPQLERQERDDGSIDYVLTGGRPTWGGQDLAACQRNITTWGFTAWNEEAQHDVADRPGALWDRDMLNASRVATFPELDYIVVAVDPAASTGQTGIEVAGRGVKGGRVHGYALADETPERGASPEKWGLAIVAAYHRWNADMIVAEVNNGGDMVEHVIRSVEGGEKLPIKLIRASRGKRTRAEPVAALFSQCVCHIVGYLPALERQLCRWEPGQGESPDRLDGLVWAFTELMLGAAPGSWEDLEELGEIEEYESRWA